MQFLIKISINFLFDLKGNDCPCILHPVAAPKMPAVIQHTGQTADRSCWTALVVESSALPIVQIFLF